MREVLALTLTALAAAYFVVGAAASASGGATLSTDKTDYRPGESVIFTGSGFNPYEQVRIVLKEDPAKHPDTTLDWSADVTITYGDTYNEQGASATDSGGSGLAGPVQINGTVNTLAVGDYVVGYSVGDNAGNNAVAVTRTVHVAKANPFVNVTPYSTIFDGSPHTATGTATGVFGEDLSSLLNFGATFTNVPGGTANWTFNSANTNPNYNPAGGSVSIVINAWTLRGFYSPVAMSLGAAVIWNNVKGGQTVPLKFNLFAGAAEKTSTSDGRGFTVTPVPCTAGLDVADDPNGMLATTGGAAFRYSGTPGLDGQFVQNWTTPGTSGKCYKVTMTALDY
jgi:hypothetical protein